MDSITLISIRGESNLRSAVRAGPDLPVDEKKRKSFRGVTVIYRIRELKALILGSNALEQQSKRFRFIGKIHFLSGS